MYFKICLIIFFQWPITVCLAWLKKIVWLDQYRQVAIMLKKLALNNAFEQRSITYLLCFQENVQCS